MSEVGYMTLRQKLLHLPWSRLLTAGHTYRWGKESLKRLSDELKVWEKC